MNEEGRDILRQLRSIEETLTDFRLEVTGKFAGLEEKVNGLAAQQAHSVSKTEFATVKSVVFGLVSAIGLALVGGLANYFFNQ